MKIWRVNESLMHEKCDACDDQRKSPCATVVFLSDAEAEIEKARRDVWHERFEDTVDKARADERERIVNAVRDALAFKVHPNILEPVLQQVGFDRVKNHVHGTPRTAYPEPKPLEHILADDLHDKRVAARFFNELVDAVKGIQAWIAGQST